MSDLLTIVGFSASLSLSHRICIIGPSNLHRYYHVRILQHIFSHSQTFNISQVVYAVVYVHIYAKNICLKKRRGWMRCCCVMNIFMMFFWVFVSLLSSLKWYDNLYGCLSFYNRKEVLLRRGPLWPHTLMATFSWGMSMTQLPTTYTNKVIGEWVSL